jgi:hypothetical protein
MVFSKSKAMQFQSKYLCNFKVDTHAISKWTPMQFQSI